jgi:hypothetical protein
MRDAPDRHPRENEMETSNEEGTALALAALALVKATIDALERQAVLKQADVHGIFERALGSLEYRAQNQATGLARRIVEGVAISRGGPSGDQDSK